MKNALQSSVMYAVKTESVTKTLRLSKELVEKLCVVAENEYRSINSQILILVRDCVKKYEAENGEISIDKKENG